MIAPESTKDLNSTCSDLTDEHVDVTDSERLLCKTAKPI
jgi:hypothetical protein